MSMVERVAKALHEMPGKGYGWDDASEAERRHAREYARAAIEAMKEPTEAMERAARVWSPSLRESYSEMISAALNEEG